METTDLYRAYLKGLLAERISRNPSYSLNALAAKAGVARGFLSEVIRGKKNLSTETAARIARRLELPPQEAERFCLLVELAGASDPAYRERVLKKLEKEGGEKKAHYDVSVDSFRAISTWYHFALIDLTGLEGFEFTPRNAARKLGISVFEAEEAIERLIRLGLLVKRPEGGYAKTKNHFLVDTKFQDEAVASFHGQILEKLLPSLKTQKANERLSRTEVLLIDPDLYPKLEEILDRASDEIVALALQSKKKRRVAALTLHLFNLIPERKTKS